MRLIAVLLLLASCSSAGRSVSTHITIVSDSSTAQATTVQTPAGIRVHAAAGSRVIVSEGIGEQPEPASGEAVSSATSEGASGNSGTAAKIKRGLFGVSFWVGLSLIMLGAGVWLSRRAGVAAIMAPSPVGLAMRLASQCPRYTGVACIGVGVFVLFFPMIVDGMEPLVPWAGVLLLAFAARWLHNATQPRRQTDADRISENTQKNVQTARLKAMHGE